MEKEIKKPDKFKIKVKNNNGKEIIDFLVEKGYSNREDWHGDLTNGYYGVNKDNIITAGKLKLTDCKEYTLEEFKKLFEPQFEVDKWYKRITTGSYIKFSHLLNDGNIRSKESIDSFNRYEAYEHGWGSNIDEFILLTDLSEIQRYLPQGHPDKINNYEIGKWYKLEAKHLSDPYYIKFKDEDESSYKSSEYLIKSKHITNDGCFFKRFNYKLSEINLSEIQQYLPDNHPDKINTTPEYVECIIDERKLYNNFGELNKIYKVIDWNYSTTDCLLEGTTSGSTAKRRFKPSTKEAYDNQNNKNMFKKDDYIVITYSDFEMSNFSINYIYKQRRNYDSLSVYKDNVNVENGLYACSFDNSGRIKWRYATKEEIDEYNRLNKPFDVTTLDKLTPGKFKIGDIVISLTEIQDSRKKGDIFKILKISGNNRFYYKKNLNTIDFETWRLATVEEIKAYNNGITNINDMIKSKYDYEVVHCKTQEEWDFVNLKLENKYRLPNSYWTYYKEDSCIVINKYQYSQLSFFKNQNNTKIYSFQEWCDKFNHKSDFNNNMNNQSKFKVGDKVCIPRTKKGNPWYKNNDKQLDDYNENYFIISNYTHNKNIGLKRADNGVFNFNLFYKSDLVLYTEDKTEEKWFPKVGDYIYANANIKGYRPQVTKIDKIYWDSNEYFHCVCKFKHLDGRLHPCLNTNWNYNIDNINNFLRPATEEEVYNYEKEQLLKKGEPMINNNSHEWFIGNNINKIITSPIELQEVNVGFSEIEKAYEKVEYQHQQLRENPLIPKESCNIKKLPTKSWY